MTTTLDSLFDPHNSLSNISIKNFCSKNNLPFHEIELSNLDKAHEKAYFIFTGNNTNSANNGNSHHWLLLYGPKIFDSYGKHDYKIPNNLSFFTNHPHQLQEYDSVVCGQYCLAFLSFAEHNPSESLEDLPISFSEYYGFTNDKQKNDRIVKSWYNKKK